MFRSRGRHRRDISAFVVVTWSLTVIAEVAWGSLWRK